MRSIRSIVVCLAALGLLAPVRASADSIYNGWSEMWGPNDGRCINEKVTEDHPDTRTGGWYQVENEWETQVTVPWVGTYYCSAASNKPAKYFRSKLTVKKWNEPKHVWGVCWQSPAWRYNSAELSNFQYQVWSEPADLALCGAGFYRVDGLVQQIVDGSWQPSPNGGSLSLKHDEYHWFPSNVEIPASVKWPDPDIDQG